MSRSQKIILIPTIFIFLTATIFYFYTASNVSRGEDTIPPKELIGYSWNNSFGWMSFNCRNNNHCGTSDYKVLVDNTGLMSGFAWSENVGWVSFNGSDLNNCPAGVCEARIKDFSTAFTTTKLLTGWAKILSDNSWIHLSGDNYGARLHSDGSISGYAWSESFGWISFEGEKYSSSVEGIYNLFPITLSGAGFKQGAVVSLKNTGGNGLEYRCVDQNNNNTFIASEDGKTLSGSCPLYAMDYGEYDVRVTNPDGISSVLSSKILGTTTPFKIIPPTSTDIAITTTASSSVGNTGPISITKIESENSLIGASVSLMKDGQTIPCFTIHEYDPKNGWIPGKDENGELLPMQCDLNNAPAGGWNFVISKTQNNDEKWRDLTTTAINVNCVPKQWTSSWHTVYNSIDEVNDIKNNHLSEIYTSNSVKAFITDNCGAKIELNGTCVPNWTPTTSCIQNFDQTANNCINKPTRDSLVVGLYGTGCGDGYKCQTVKDSTGYGTCIVDTTKCNKTFACHNGDWECGDATDLCGNNYDCGSCDNWKSCNSSHQCKY